MCLVSSAVRASGRRRRQVRSRGDRLRAERNGNALAVSTEAVMRRARQSKPVDRQDLLGALGSASDAPLQIALAPTADSRRVLAQLMPNLPSMFGGGPSAPITEG